MALSEIKLTSERIKITQIKKVPKHSVTEAWFFRLSPLDPWIHAPCTFSTHSSSLNFSLSWDKLRKKAQHQPLRHARHHLFYSCTAYMKLPFLKIKTNPPRSLLKLMEINYFKANWRSGKTGDWPENTAYSYTLCLQLKWISAAISGLFSSTSKTGMNYTNASSQANAIEVRGPLGREIRLSNGTVMPNGHKTSIKSWL